VSKVEVVLLITFMVGVYFYFRNDIKFFIPETEKTVIVYPQKKPIDIPSGSIVTSITSENVATGEIKIYVEYVDAR